MSSTAPSGRWNICSVPVDNGSFFPSSFAPFSSPTPVPVRETKLFSSSEIALPKSRKSSQLLSATSFFLIMEPPGRRKDPILDAVSRVVLGVIAHQIDIGRSCGGVPGGQRHFTPVDNRPQPTQHDGFLWLLGIFAHLDAQRRKRRSDLAAFPAAVILAL